MNKIFYWSPFTTSKIATVKAVINSAGSLNKFFKYKNSLSYKDINKINCDLLINCDQEHEITKKFYELTQKGDLILNMGAGDCHNFWPILNGKNNFNT